jgi:hypothetical protein
MLNSDRVNMCGEGGRRHRAPARPASRSVNVQIRRSDERPLGVVGPWPALVTHGEALSILGVCEPDSAAGAEVVKLAPHRRGRLSGPRRHALGQLAQLGEHTLHTAAKGCVAGVEVAGVLAPDFHQAALTMLKISRQLARLPV